MDNVVQTKILLTYYRINVRILESKQESLNPFTKIAEIITMFY